MALQRSHGNRAVVSLMRGAGVIQRSASADDMESVPFPQLNGHGPASSEEMEASVSVSVHGLTEAKYNGGAWSISGQKATRSTDCGECPPGKRCIHVTGTLVTNYLATITITMPGVPAGLSRCEAAAVRRFIDTTLRAHELEHQRRFKTYNGTTRNAFDVTGCGMADVTQQLKDIQATEATERAANANTLSGAIDPFDVEIESNCP